LNANQPDLQKNKDTTDIITKGTKSKAVNVRDESYESTYPG
jgi:hypothetical protein